MFTGDRIDEDPWCPMGIGLSMAPLACAQPQRVAGRYAAVPTRCWSPASWRYVAPARRPRLSSASLSPCGSSGCGLAGCSARSAPPCSAFGATPFKQSGTWTNRPRVALSDMTMAFALIWRIWPSAAWSARSRLPMDRWPHIAGLPSPCDARPHESAHHFVCAVSPWPMLVCAICHAWPESAHLFRGCSGSVNTAYLVVVGHRKNSPQISECGALLAMLPLA